MIEEEEEELLGCGRCRVRKNIWATILIMMIEVVLFADMDLLAPVLTPVAREFGFVETYPNGTVVMEYDDRLDKFLPKVDAQMRDQKLGGDITIGFFVVGGVCSVVVGMLADFLPRVKLLALVVVFGGNGLPVNIFHENLSTTLYCEGSHRYWCGWGNAHYIFVVRGFVHRSASRKSNWNGWFGTWGRGRIWEYH